MKSSSDKYNDLIKTYPVYLTKREYAAVRCAIEEALEAAEDNEYAYELNSVLENFTYIS
jgi:hypothetical protein